MAWVLFCKAIWRIYSNRVGDSGVHVLRKTQQGLFWFEQGRWLVIKAGLGYCD